MTTKTPTAAEKIEVYVAPSEGLQEKRDSAISYLLGWIRGVLNSNDMIYESEYDTAVSKAEELFGVTLTGPLREKEPKTK